MGIAHTPEQTLNYQTVHRNAGADFGSAAFELLLIRMEALQLEPDAVRRIEPSVFGDLAKACAACANKNRCQSDLAYESAGTATPSCENYCPNAATLNAMRALPWFGNGPSSPQTKRC
jgi:hypothetical protein